MKKFYLVLCVLCVVLLASCTKEEPVLFEMERGTTQPITILDGGTSMSATLLIVKYKVFLHTYNTESYIIVKGPRTHYTVGEYFMFTYVTYK